MGAMLSRVLGLGEAQCPVPPVSDLCWGCPGVVPGLTRAVPWLSRARGCPGVVPVNPVNPVNPM